MFTTDSDILNGIASVMKQPSQAALLTLGSFWTGVVAIRHIQVYNDILNAFLVRGYLIAQITSWDYGVTVEKAITIYRCLVDNAVLSQAGAEFIRLAESYIAGLDKMDLVVAGAIVEPQGVAGQAAAGPMSQCASLTAPNLGDNLPWRWCGDHDGLGGW